MHLSDPSVRYLGAWEEISQRLGVRAQLHVAHIAAVVALAGVYLQAMSTSVGNDVSLVGVYAAFSLLLISTAIVFLQRHNEGILGILSAHCRHFERHAKDCGEAQPSWFNDSYQKLSLELRKHSDRVTNSIVLVSPTMYALQAVVLYKENANAATTVVFQMTVIFLVISSIWSLWMTLFIRETPKLRSAYISLTYDYEICDIPVKDLREKLNWSDDMIKEITGRSEADDEKTREQKRGTP